MIDLNKGVMPNRATDPASADPMAWGREIVTAKFVWLQYQRLWFRLSRREVEINATKIIC
jgi:hypothetical protein